jgi:hypothetical protein
MADEGRGPNPGTPEPQPTAGTPGPGQPGQQPGGPQQIQVPVDLSSLNSGYVNWFRFTGSAEELIIDLGLAPQLGQMPPTEPIKLTHRLVMSFYTAKRLLQNMHRAISIYESHYGPVEIDPNRRLRTPPGQRPMGS